MKSFLFAFSIGCVVAATASAQTASVQAAADRTDEMVVWKDRSGMFELRAEFVQLENDQVRLRGPDGKEVDVPLAKLDDAGQALARRLAEERALKIPPGLEPVELLKKARAQFEQIPAEFRNARMVVPLALVECLYGDREAGRKHFAKALELAAGNSESFGLFADYSSILEAQQEAGLIEDARETIRLVDEACKKIPDDRWNAEMFQLSFGASAVRFLVSVRADAEAGKYIAKLRATQRKDAETTTRDLRELKLAAAIAWAFDQIMRGDKHLATTTLSYAESSFADVAKDRYDLPEMWYRAGEREKAFRLVDEFAKSHSDGEGDRVLAARAYEELALACLEHRDRENGKKYFDLSRQGPRSVPDTQLIRFHVASGDFEAAAAEARKTGDDAASVPAALRQRNLRSVAVTAGRAWKRDLAAALLREADILTPEGKTPSNPIEAATPRMTAAGHALAAGDIGALVKAADEIGNPIMQYVANLYTAMEIHARTTKKGRNIFLPSFDL